MKATLVIASLFLVVVLVLSWTNPNAVYGETADFSEYEPSDTFFSRLFDSIFGVFIGDSSGFSDEQDEVNRDDIIVFERIHDEPSRDESPPTDDDGDGDGGDEDDNEESQSSALSYV